MIKCTNFWRKYVTSTPLFHEKTHFFKKKAEKRHEKAPDKAILRAQDTASNSQLHANQLAHEHEKTTEKSWRRS